MIQEYEIFKEQLLKRKIKMENDKLDDIIYSFKYSILNDENYQEIQQKINNSILIVSDESYECIIVCFEWQIIIADKSYHNIIKNKTNFDQKIEEGIKNFEYLFILKMQQSREVIQFWSKIRHCISAYLIKKSYLEINKNRVEDFLNDNNKIEPKNYNSNEFIQVRKIDQNIELVFHIKSKKMFSIKTFSDNDDGKELYTREMNNYKNINYPFIPKFYGTINNRNQLVIEFINGNTINNTINEKYGFIQKVKNTLEILYTFQYLHQNL